MIAGLKFWKVNSRKFFAIPEDDLLAPVSKKRRLRTDDNTGGATATITSNCICEENIDDVRRELAAINSKLCDVFQLTKDAKMPLGLKQLLKQAFTCMICRGLICPPVIATRCCRSIAGCDSCIKTWYATDRLDKPCPSCGTERGYVETMRLHGIDDLYEGLKPLLDDC